MIHNAKIKKGCPRLLTVVICLFLLLISAPLTTRALTQSGYTIGSGNVPSSAVSDQALQQLSDYNSPRTQDPARTPTERAQASVDLQDIRIEQAARQYGQSSQQVQFLRDKRPILQAALDRAQGTQSDYGNTTAYLAAPDTLAAGLDINQKSSKNVCYLTSGIGGGGDIGQCLNDALAWTLARIISLLGWLMWAASEVFDYVMKISVKEFGAVGGLGKLPSILIIWGILRNFVNVAFIFVLIYVAIGTILQLSFGDKKLIVNVIIIALLVNFSLFFTRIIIDVSNVLGNQFYNQLTVDNRGQPVNLANKFYEKLDIPSAFQTKSDTIGNKTIGNTGSAKGDNFSGVIVKYAGALVLILMGTFVMLAACIIFIIRAITLIILMILSPAAFGFYAIPGMKKYFDEWLGKLISNAFLAPIFLFFVWASFKILESTSSLSGASGDGFANKVLPRVLMIGFMLGSLMAAKKFSGVGAGWGMKMAKLATVGAAAGIGGYVGGGLARQTLGRAANAAAGSNAVQRMAARMPILGGKFKSGFEAVAGAKFGAKKGFKQNLEARAKAAADFKNPEQQAEYIKRLGGMWGTRWTGMGKAQQKAAYEKLSNEDKVKLEGGLGKNISDVEDNDTSIKASKANITKLEQERAAAEQAGDTSKARALGDEIAAENTAIADRRRVMPTEKFDNTAAEGIITTKKAEMEAARAAGDQAKMDKLNIEIEEQKNLIKNRESYSQNRGLHAQVKDMERSLNTSERKKVADIRDRNQNKDQRKDRLKNLKKKLAEKQDELTRATDDAARTRIEDEMENIKDRIDNIESRRDISDTAGKPAGGAPAGGGGAPTPAKP